MGDRDTLLDLDRWVCHSLWEAIQPMLDAPAQISSSTFGDTEYCHQPCHTWIVESRVSSRRVESSRELRSCWHRHRHWRGSRSWKIPSGTVKEAASVREITSCPWLFVEPITRHPSAVISFSHSSTNSFFKSRHTNEIAQATCKQRWDP